MKMQVEHVDVLVVGAGISGIGAAYHLQSKCPGRSYAILEGREHLGGTWDLFRYPGIRSDSDMYTLGYAFRPWQEAKSIADGPSILNYLEDTAREYGIVDKIRFNHQVKAASWSSADGRWLVRSERSDTGESKLFTACFLFLCSGYYDYEKGYTPNFEGKERFSGPIIHPQHWAADVSCENKRVVVIGSGATAMTLVPELARTASHVTMLQRSPTYVVSAAARDRLPAMLARFLPKAAVYGMIRWRNILLGMLFYWFCRHYPDRAKKLLIGGVRSALGPGYDVEKHFTPDYKPWDQRVCLVPDADLFEAIRSGRATVITDQIDSFTETGLKLVSGQLLEADIVVTATGLNLKVMGGIDLEVDGTAINPGDLLTYKGMMFSDVPNLALSSGYTNASWTLKTDLTCEFVCRLLNYMEAHDHSQCCPRARDPGIKPEPFLDFSAGYVLRAIDRFPKQGNRKPWRLYQNYLLDILSLGYGSLEDKVMEFSSPTMLPGGAEKDAQT